MHASGSVVGKRYHCCFCSSFLSSISLHIQKSEKCSVPSCLRANVNQQDKPSEDVMGLTTDDPSALRYHPVACIVCWTTSSRRKQMEIQQRTPSSPSFWCWEGTDAHSGYLLLLLFSSCLWSREFRGNNPGTWERKKWVNVKNIAHLGFLSLASKMLDQALESCCLREDADTRSPRMPALGWGSRVLLGSSSGVPVLCFSHLQKETPTLADRWWCLCWQRVPELIYSTCSAFSEQQMRCLIIHGRCIIAGN